MMNNYNKILEAVNRGIQLALDDFNDEESVLNIKSKLINHRDYTKEYLDLMNEVVDLGLPSGTLWCKYNLDVDSTKLLTPVDWYGDYYAWGELEPNKTNEDSEIYFDWKNYKFGKSYNKLTKYCSNFDFGLKHFTDTLILLLPEDDVAYLNKKLHNFKFHIPSKELCEELIDYTNNYWVDNYDPNKIKHNPKNDKGIKGLNGMVFEGKNGNLMFIPAAGYRTDFDNNFIGSECNLWTSNLKLGYPYNAYYFCFKAFKLAGTPIYNGFRCFGFTIRPVINL